MKNVNTIRLRDLDFKLLISAEEIAKKVEQVGRAISEDYGDTELLVLPVLKGGFIFAADLARAISLQQQFRFVLLSTYGDSTSSTGSVKKVEGLDGLDIYKKHVLIVEDIVDTGFSVEFLRKELANRGAASIKVAAMFYKPDAFQGEHPPEYFGMEIPDAFVVGYGLDYAQLGRELPDLWVKA
ncbi:MAG: hypoxanthine phosphoribosyltransferase [Bacteroidia bacterium]